MPLARVGGGVYSLPIVREPSELLLRLIIGMQSLPMYTYAE